MEFRKTGQGAIEYLLMLAAAIVVVAIVISFLTSTIQPVQVIGNKQLYDGICTGPLAGDGNSLLCGCYIKNLDANYGEIGSGGTWIQATPANCPSELPEEYWDEPLLNWVPTP